ncbi:biotin-dependent carboxyltransferase family protein [Dietzia sp.]|uniref:5-oxoprolinase subunit C family protein n=1 Tax=Dietzia sp. TaxID=1871616 RepID=UPI002FDB4126
MSHNIATIHRTGPLATVQDLGRPGHMGTGIPVSGAVDRRSHGLAQRLVGNAESRAGIEATMGGLELSFSADVTVAVTGAELEVFVGSRREATNAVLRVPAGTRVRLGAPRAGLRSYIAVAGGFEVPALFGSRSTDLLSGLGPDPLAEGDELPVGVPDTAEAPAAPEARVEQAAVAPLSTSVEVRLLPGPRIDWFTRAALDTLRSESYTVGARSNRIGVRLEGAALERERSGELTSEGIVRGAVQVPAGGEPLVFMADHPTTGGYPVIAVVHPEDQHLLAQLGPGGRVRFRMD